MLKMSLFFIFFISCCCYGFDIVYDINNKAVYGVKVSTKTATESNRIDITGIGFSIAGANPDKLKILDVQMQLPKDFKPLKYKLTQNNTSYILNPEYEVIESSRSIVPRRLK